MASPHQYFGHVFAGALTSPAPRHENDLGHCDWQCNGRMCQFDPRRRKMGMREEYLAVMEKQLQQWKTQADKFKAEAGQMEAHAKVQYEKNLEYLHARQEEAWASFSRLEGASENAWEQFKVNMDNAGRNLKAAAERMTTQIRK
jgi:hypothetical protein